MSNVAVIDRFVPIFDGAKTFVLEKANSNPVVAIALAVLLPLTLVVAVVWGIRKVCKGSNNEIENKTDQSAKDILKSDAPTFKEKVVKFVQARPYQVVAAGVVTLSLMGIGAYYKYSGNVELPGNNDTQANNTNTNGTHTNGTHTNGSHTNGADNTTSTDLDVSSVLLPMAGVSVAATVAWGIIAIISVKVCDSTRLRPNFLKCCCLSKTEKDEMAHAKKLEADFKALEGPILQVIEEIAEGKQTNQIYGKIQEFLNNNPELAQQIKDKITQSPSIKEGVFEKIRGYINGMNAHDT